MGERLGKTVQIHNNSYTIIMCDKNDEELIMEDGRTHCGVTDFVEKKIYIRNDLDRDVLEYTLLHEITHAFINSYGFLQVEWDDEIVADFVGYYLRDIVKIVNEIAPIVSI